MNSEEIKKKIALLRGQGNQVDLAGVLADVLEAIIDTPAPPANDPRIIGAVSAVSPATLGTCVSIDSNTNIGGDVTIGRGARIGEDVSIGGNVKINDGVTLTHSIEFTLSEEGQYDVSFYNNYDGSRIYVPSCYDGDLYPAQVTLIVNELAKEIGVKLHGAQLGTITLE